MNSKLTCFIKEEGILILLHVLRGSGLIQEQRVNPFDVLHLNFRTLKKPKHTDDYSNSWLSCWNTIHPMIYKMHIDIDNQYFFFFFLNMRCSCLFTLSLPCVCDTQVQQCWSAGWRSEEMSPCRCESGQCEPLRSAQHPPPHTWNETRHVYFPFITLGRSKRRRCMQTLTGS